MRVADFAMEIPAPRKGLFQDCPTQVHREKAMSHVASERFANDEVNLQRTRALEALGTIVDSPIADKRAYIWTCPVVLEDDATCAKDFSSKKALLSHMRSEHKIRNILAAACVTNLCPFCRGAFHSTSHALQHARRAINLGCCRTCFARLPYEPDERPKHCPICFFTLQLSSRTTCISEVTSLCGHCKNRCQDP